MKTLIPLRNIDRKLKKYTGSKASSLSVLSENGINIPGGICITSHVYNSFISSTKLKNLIFMELNRKDFSSMRWEEIWDISLRIRNFFLNTPLPEKIYRNLKKIIDINFKDKYVAVRSSAPGEDSRETSFAGLHESYLNITGTEEIIKHIKLVWASLWSDGALLYRKEL
ncbi:MAG: PEP/pyruvate-binding domain-containing protein, partial [Candidatus Eremiobacterota bacterium]